MTMITRKTYKQKKVLTANEISEYFGVRVRDINRIADGNLGQGFHRLEAQELKDFTSKYSEFQGRTYALYVVTRKGARKIAELCNRMKEFEELDGEYYNFDYRGIKKVEKEMAVQVTLEEVSVTVEAYIEPAKPKAQAEEVPMQTLAELVEEPVKTLAQIAVEETVDPLLSSIDCIHLRVEELIRNTKPNAFKAAAYDAFVKSKGMLSTKVVSELFGITEYELIDFLRQKGIFGQNDYIYTGENVDELFYYFAPTFKPLIKIKGVELIRILRGI